MLAGSSNDTELASESHPVGDDVPAGERTAGCGDVLTLASPQPPPTLSLGSAHVLPSMAADMAPLAQCERRTVACRLGPPAPPGTLRALLQIYRL